MNLKQSVKISLAITIVLLLSSMANASFLDDEAGISAYSTVSTVDIAVAATAYKNIEYQTSDYIIGSVAIPNYGEAYDVHVYLHVSGEIIAYYLRDEHLCKMIDWKAYHSTKQISGSKLHTALDIVASAMGVPLSEITLYDFRYPNPQNIKIIVDNVYAGTSTFRYLIPGSYTVHAAFWSHATFNGSGTFRLDDVVISTGLGTFWGDLNSSQIQPDIFHNGVNSAGSYDSSYVAIILLYTEP